jgi:Protein of unknown function (DUF3606)
MTDHCCDHADPVTARACSALKPKAEATLPGRRLRQSLADEGELGEDSRPLQRARGMAMGKRPKKRDYGDKTRIDMNQPYQMAYWKQRFGVSDQELEDAVHAVGTSVKKIEAYLKSKDS